MNKRVDMDRVRVKRVSNQNRVGLSIIKTSLLMGTLMFVAFTYLMINLASF